MAYPVVTGAVLVEANGAALNNAGQAEGLRVDNAVVVKQIRLGRLRFPYVSGQAWRRWWREVLYEDFGWKPSEVTRESKSAYTAGNPILYEEDDLFGYMVARKGKGAGSGTYRRISPLKNSLMISVLPNVITRDFGHFSRNLPPDADIIPFESEHYTTYLQGVFTVSLSDVGRFTVGEMADVSDEIIKTHAEDLKKDEEDGRVYRIDLKERVRRVQDLLRALARLRGGAQLARNLSEVSPVVVLVGFLDGGNAPFQRIFEPDVNNEKVLLNLKRLGSVLSDYRDRMLSPGNGKPLLFGYRPTLLANEEEVLNNFENNESFSDLVDVAGTPIQALEKAAKMVDHIFSTL